MARWETEDYENFPYELRGTVMDKGKKCGFAPIPVVNTLTALAAWVLQKTTWNTLEEEHPDDAKTVKAFEKLLGKNTCDSIVASWKHGHAIEIQGLIRDAVSKGPKYTNAAESRIMNTLDWSEFQGDYDGLRKAARAIWDEEQLENSDGDDISTEKHYAIGICY